MTYAVMRVKATGKRFLFVSTHLDPKVTRVKVAQWRELIRRINAIKGSLPVVSVGDYNVQKFDVTSRSMLPAMKNAGYGDVLNQSYRVNPVAHRRARRSINGWVNSLGRYTRDVRSYSYYKNHAKTGNSIDYVFASNRLVVKEFKMVLRFSATTLRVRGTIPSDHNMVRATIRLP
jgi:endonuclease/exonuclease/phosphatase family metal-dependent hydrolase